MGVRQQAYWLRQADAVRRRGIADVAYGVSIGMATPEDRKKAIDGLELEETAAESKEKQSKATWDMLLFMKGGKGV